MDKYLKAGLWIIFGLATWPFIKNFIDTFTDPETGLMITYECSDELVALTGFVPWVLPLITFILAIYVIVKPEDKLKRPPE